MSSSPKVFGECGNTGQPCHGAASCPFATIEPIIGDVRGRGLLFGLDLVLDKKTKAPACDEADRVLYACLASGLSFKTSTAVFSP
jgi:adenosylmethionine-8-amino-7-oxononanoate aminotransferase